VALLMASRRLWWVVIGGLLAAELLVRGLPGDLVVVALAAAR
jgi:two-component system sensor kinase FixL